MPFRSTCLFHLLSSLAQPGVSIALWYGNDYADLEKTRDPERFFAEVESGILHPSVECYAVLLG